MTEPVAKEEFEERCAVDGRRVKGGYSLDFAHNTVTAKIGGKTSILPMDCMMKVSKTA